MSYESIIRRSVDEENADIKLFGSTEAVFERASRIASIVLNKKISPYDVAMISTAIEMGRLPVNRADPEVFSKTINGIGIGYALAQHPESAACAAEDNLRALVEKSSTAFIRPAISEPEQQVVNTDMDEGRAP